MMKGYRCQNNVKISKNGIRGSPSGSKGNRQMSSNKQTYFLTQEHKRNYAIVPDARRFLTMHHWSRGWEKNKTKHIIQTHTNMTLQLRDPGLQSMEKTKGTDAHLASSQWNSLKLSPCPWIGAHAKILPCLARSHPLVMKLSNVAKRRKIIFKGPNNWSHISMYEC